MMSLCIGLHARLLTVDVVIHTYACVDGPHRPCACATMNGFLSRYTLLLAENCLLLKRPNTEVQVLCDGTKNARHGARHGTANGQAHSAHTQSNSHSDCITKNWCLGLCCHDLSKTLNQNGSRGTC